MLSDEIEKQSIQWRSIKLKSHVKASSWKTKIQLSDDIEDSQQCGKANSKPNYTAPKFWQLQRTACP